MQIYDLFKFAAKPGHPYFSEMPAGCLIARPALKHNGMTFCKLSFSAMLLTLFLACGEERPERFFSIHLGGDGSKFTAGDVVPIRLEARGDRVADSVSYLLGGQPLQVTDGQVRLEPPTLGTKSLEARFYSEGREITLNRDILILARQSPEIYTYEILNAFPHDREAFTQGLEFHGDILYESTGIKGASSVRRVDFQTGEVLAKTDLDRTFFGEGITVLGDTLFMLTWQSGQGFLYNRHTLERLGSFSYGQSKEGWGLCNDGKVLYKSDGSERIWKLDPATLEETGYIETVTNKSAFNKTNELEYVDGKIYANVWQKPSMMIIDAVSGAIEGVVNFGGLEKQITQHENLDVLNGVAYHPGRNTFFVTGKRWDKLFEVRIVKRNP